MGLEHKIQIAIKLLQSFAGSRVVEVCYSGGKDSDVILELVRMAGIQYRAIYKNTTIDPPGTIAHCKSKGVEIVNPKTTFFELIKKHGMPTRRARFCCTELKEYKISPYAIQGIRRCESPKRAARYKEPTICRVYGNKDNSVDVCLPILNWSNIDVALFITMRRINCHPLYYNEHGNLNVESRLGCLGCPMKSDNGCGDFKRYPKFFKKVVECVKIWYDTHPNIKSREKFGSPYDLIYHNLFCKSYDEYIYAKQKDLFGFTLDCKQYLEQYFDIKL